MPKTTTKSIRVVQATNPHTGATWTRQSKTKHYTHALIAHYNARPAYTIPAGTYTVPAKKIRGHCSIRRAYETTLTQDSVHDGETAGCGFMSFHTSLAAADKAGRALVSKSASVAAENKAIFGDVVPGIPWVSRYEIVEAVQI
jgi:hypothetical protein